MKIILYIALAIATLGGLFLPILPKGSYYIIVSLLIFLLCKYIYLSNRKSFVCFLLFGLSINNLADELFFDPSVFQMNELLIMPSIIFIWLIKCKKNDEKFFGE